MRKVNLFAPALVLSLAFAAPAFAASAGNGVDDDCNSPTDEKTYQGAPANPKAIEERKKCFTSHFKADSKSERGERVMRPAYGAGKDKPTSKPGRVTSDDGSKPQQAGVDMFIKIDDIKGEAE